MGAPMGAPMEDCSSSRLAHVLLSAEHDPKPRGAAGSVSLLELSEHVRDALDLGLRKHHVSL